MDPTDKAGKPNDDPVKALSRAGLEPEFLLPYGRWGTLYENLLKYLRRYGKMLLVEILEAHRVVVAEVMAENEGVWVIGLCYDIAFRATIFVPRARGEDIVLPAPDEVRDEFLVRKARNRTDKIRDFFLGDENPYARGRTKDGHDFITGSALDKDAAKDKAKFTKPSSDFRQADKDPKPKYTRNQRKRYNTDRKIDEAVQAIVEAKNTPTGPAASRGGAQASKARGGGFAGARGRGGYNGHARDHQA